MGLFSFLNAELLATTAQALKQVATKAAVAVTPGRDVKYIFVHCTAGPPNQSTQEIKNYWARKYPTWKGRPGYHIMVDADGTRHRLQEDWLYTNGVAGYNSHALHVCYKGGQGGKDTRTPAQKRELLLIIARWKKMYPNAKVLGHRDASPDKNKDGQITADEWIKTCPNFNAIPEYQHL